MKSFMYVGLSLSFFILSCSEQEEKSEQVYAPTFSIQPPIDALDPKGENFLVDNTKDTILVTHTGSFVHIPNHCFVDKNGKAIEQAEVNFVEYQNVADIYLSGIPMSCIDGEDTMTFQSAGMCKIKAFKDGNELYLAENKKIDIGLRNKQKDEDHNLYFFDEQKGEWIEKEKNLKPNTTILPKKVLNPNGLDTNRIVDIKINNAKNRARYGMWDNSRFYLLPDQERKYKEDDIFWYDMYVKETDESDVFLLAFNGANYGKQFKEKFLAQPLPGAGQYEEAVKVFQDRVRKQAKVILEENQRVENEIEASKKESEKIDEMIKQEQIKDSISYIKFQKSLETQREVTRVFSVQQMGIFNCDRFYTAPIVAEEYVNFTHKNQPVKVSYLSLCNVNDNTVLRNVSVRNQKEYHLKLTNGEHLLVGTYENKILVRTLNPETIQKSMELKEVDTKELQGLVERPVM